MSFRAKREIVSFLDSTKDKISRFARNDTSLALLLKAGSHDRANGMAGLSCQSRIMAFFYYKMGLYPHSSRGAARLLI
jgi:hypothetical protein